VIPRDNLKKYKTLANVKRFPRTAQEKAPNNALSDEIERVPPPQIGGEQKSFYFRSIEKRSVFAIIKANPLPCANASDGFS
jgi:hypothetical protein